MKNVVIALFLFFSFFGIGFAETGEENLLTNIRSGDDNHIFGITSYDVKNDFTETHQVLPDLTNGVKTFPKNSNTFFWRVVNTSECSTETGKITNVVKCFERLQGGNIKESDPVECSHLPKPEEVVNCATTPSSYFWKKSFASSCSSNCGAGTVQLKHSCYYVDENNVKTEKSKNECELALGAVGDSEPCFSLSGCLYHWESSDWSECSTICGGTRNQNRINSCIDDRTGEVVDASLCTNPEPVKVKTCTEGCDSYMSCKALLDAHPELTDGYYELIIGGSPVTKYCDMANGGYMYLGRYTFNAQSIKTAYPGLPFRSIRVKYVSGKIICANVDQCPGSVSAVRTYSPSSKITRLSYRGSWYTHTASADNTSFQYGDYEKMGGQWGDNHGSMTADMYVR